MRGIEDAHLIFRCEPGHPQVAELCAGADFAREVTVIVNDERYGALGNPWHAFESGFKAGAEFVILAEDDSPVADDILEWFAWADVEYGDRPEVLAACAFRHHCRPGGPYYVRVEPYFKPTVWGTWRWRWEHLLRDDWDLDYRHKGWDWRIIEHWIGERGYLVAAPCESRSQVSGEYGGTHLQPGEMYRQHLSDCFSPHYEPGAYAEVS